MKTINIPHTEISTLDCYWNKLKDLSVGAKLELISRLSSSLLSKTGEVTDKKKWVSPFAGHWKDERPAEEIIDDLRNSRTPNRVEVRGITNHLEQLNPSNLKNK